MANENELETREVRVEDPSLSPEANAALTRELQDAVGAKEVQVPADAPHYERDVRREGGRAPSDLVRNRLLIIITAVAALIVGAIIALVTKQWWVLLIPVAVHAIGTVLVGTVVGQMTTQAESPDPTLIAQLEDEGVGAPERVFNELVDEFGADAAGDQKAMTPSGTDTEPAGGDTTIVMGFQWAIIAGLAIVSLVGAVLDGGRSWFLPAVMLPVCGGWVAYQLSARKNDQDPDHADPDAVRRRAKLVVAGCVAAALLVAIVVVILATSS